MKNNSEIVNNTMCKSCLREHKEMTGYEPIDCAFKAFDNEYCEEAQELANYITNKDQKIDQLKQQLAEKDKEIESLKKADNIWLDSYQNELDTLRQNQTQLAIQELEKVKDRIKHFCNIHSDDYYGVKSQVKGVELDICEEIDNQINELKGEKK